MNSMDNQHSILNSLYLESAADLLSANGLHSCVVQESAPAVSGAGETAYVSVLCANGEGVALSSMIKIDKHLLASIHPLQPATVSQRDLEDWCRELNNQLVGRMKNKLLRYGVTVSLGLPVLLTGTDVSAVAAPDLTINDHSFALDNGRLMLTLSTFVDPAIELKETESVSDDEGAYVEGSIALF
jgi:hypothetical protein